MTNRELSWLAHPKTLLQTEMNFRDEGPKLDVAWMAPLKQLAKAAKTIAKRQKIIKVIVI